MLVVNARTGDSRNYDRNRSWRTVSIRVAVSRTHISHKRNFIIAVSFLETHSIP
jgi:hypothetical protein